MKKVFSFLLVLAASVAFAQAPKGECKNPPPPHPSKSPAERANHFTDRMEKDLALTADQKTKVHALTLTREQKMDELREKYKGQDKSVWAAERKKVRDEFEEGLKKTVTADQYQKWEQIKKERKEKKGPPPPPPGQAPPANGENPPPPPPDDED